MYISNISNDTDQFNVDCKNVIPYRCDYRESGLCSVVKCVCDHSGVLIISLNYDSFDFRVIICIITFGKKNEKKICNGHMFTKKPRLNR